MTKTVTATAHITTSPQYKELCETLSMFCAAKKLDEKSREQLATLMALALRIGGGGKDELIETCKLAKAGIEAHMEVAGQNNPLFTADAILLDKLNAAISSASPLAS